MTWALIAFVFYTILATSYLLFLAFTSVAEAKTETKIQYIVKETPAKLLYQTFEVTAYTAGLESTGKTENDAMFGITASGENAVERITLACPPSMAFGTKVYIPAFENVFTCQDRGSAIIEGKLDIFMEQLDQAKMFGRQKLEVLILP